MLDRLGIPVRDLAVSRDFYLAALGPLGYELLMQPAGHVEAVHHGPTWKTRQEER